MARANIGVSMAVGADGVAVITIRNPPVNALHPSVIAGLKAKYTEAFNRDDVIAIVLTGDGGKFCGGFDISVFGQIHKSGDLSLLPDVSVELVVDVMEDGKKPSVAAIQGLALGGGLELTMGCHARISTPEAQLGLPELTLGVIPGFGGTQRLPRLVGLPKAIEMMLQSKFITAREGKECGLVDALCSPDELIKVARLWAVHIANRQKPWISSLRRTDRLGSLAEARAILSAARQQAKRMAPNVPQHQACLDAVEEGVVFGGYAGVLKETKIFKELVVSTTCRALVHAFFAQRLTSKVPNVTDVGLKPRQIKKVAIIGGGLMGSGIATAFLLSSIPVVLKEVDSKFLERGQKMIVDNLQVLVKKGSLTKEKMNNTMSLLTGALDYGEFKNVDLVIEAVIEKVPLKQSIFADIEKACPPHCILASNTSTIDLHVVGERTTSQDRIVGAHFFSPAHIMPLLEIVRTEKTSAQVVLDLIAVGKIIKKVPVVVGNCTGFAVNRTFFPYSQSAQFLVALGVDLFRIDQVISAFGMPMGPFQLQDVAGYGVALAVRPIFDEAFKGRTIKRHLVELMVKDERQGKLNGKGYYTYEKGSKPKPDPTVRPIIEEYRRLMNVMPSGKPVTLTDQEIMEMVFFPVVNEACRVMDEKIVVQASDLDISSILGMGFPKYRGGLVLWADTVGAPYIYSKLSKWAEMYGGFYKPSSYLESRARSGLPLSLESPTPTKASKSRL